MLRLWDSVTPLVLILRSCVRKAINLVTYFEFGNIFWIKNIFVLLNSSLEREVMIKKRKIFQFYENFTLVWRDLHKMEINVWSPDLQYNSSNFPVDNFNFKLTFLKSFKSDSKDIFFPPKWLANICSSDKKGLIKFTVFQNSDVYVFKVYRVDSGMLPLEYTVKPRKLWNSKTTLKKYLSIFSCCYKQIVLLVVTY